MSFQIIRIEDKCNECMLCVRDCAAGVWRDIEGVPVPFAPDLCNLCSHCVAVCQRGAIEHSGLDVSQVRKAAKKGLDPDGYREITLTRRSVREYKNKEVPKDVIEKILDLARYSPTASNTQNVSYTVVTDRDLIKRASKRIFGFGLKANDWVKKPAGKLIFNAFKKTNIGTSVGRYSSALDYYITRSGAGKDYILHNAPVVILISAPKKASFSCDNCNIAATNIINYAHAMGLGTCFIGFITVALRYDSRLRSWFHLPRGNQVFATLVMGYPSYSHAFTPARNKPQVDWIEKQVKS